VLPGELGRRTHEHLHARRRRRTHRAEEAPSGEGQGLARLPSAQMRSPRPLGDSGAARAYAAAPKERPPRMRPQPRWAMEELTRSQAEARPALPQRIRPRSEPTDQDPPFCLGCSKSLNTAAHLTCCQRGRGGSSGVKYRKSLCSVTACLLSGGSIGCGFWRERRRQLALLLQAGECVHVAAVSSAV
jgi:hypothetical protein